MTSFIDSPIRQKIILEGRYHLEYQPFVCSLEKKSLWQILTLPTWYMTAKKVLEARWISWDSQIILSGPAEPPKSWLGHPFLVDIICPFVWNRVKASNPNSLLMFLTACSLSRSQFFVFLSSCSCSSAISQFQAQIGNIFLF